ncbi:hypothetical protein SEVIR_6G219101v4 [Setaria viridis]|uniref:Uncharacterized protein n=1 Tax=Setaria viridis TaxID=4556 RepID=A0A4U6U6A2_SETVI|nr:hypothetical protein SEVIR_6G219101v2 [Setaria viridis]
MVNHGRPGPRAGHPGRRRRGARALLPARRAAQGARGPCTGEGVLLVEADADVRLEHIGNAVHPPLPCLDELLFDVPGSSAIVNSPLLLFVVAVRLNHVMADAQGLLQFLEAVAELARGVAVPAMQPVWERHLLMARDPPRPSFPHPEYNEVPVPPDTNPGAAVPVDANAMARCSFFFGAREITAIKALLPPHLRNRSTTFEILLGFLWKLLTMALAPDDEEEVHVGFVASARGGKSGGLHIPNGYYGNSFALPVAIHGRRAPREPGGPRRGAGPEGQGGSGRGVHPVRGRPHGAARAAQPRGGARVRGVRPDQGRVRRPRLRVGQARVRRRGERRTHPRVLQLPRARQERRQRGRRRRADVAAGPRHGQV